MTDMQKFTRRLFGKPTSIEPPTPDPDPEPDDRDDTQKYLDQLFKTTD